ncbi:MAG: pilus assembly protein PilM, partial [Candidatus Omnitrophica bacterium]|nr:pilus assembly protein PilM [Candidatus Omnitrophota bacterium]
MMTSVGIEINKQYVKLAVVNKGTKHLDCFAGSVESFTDEQVIQKIIDMLRGQKIKAKGVTLCLSRDSVTVRNLHLPSRSTKEIAQMIDLHIARVVPYKKEEIVFSHQFLGADEMGYARVLLAIVQIEVIRRLARILEKAGLFVEQISFSSWGLWQWVNKNCHAQITQGEMHIILDVDSLFSDFIIFSQQGFLFTRSIGIGSSSIRQSSQQGLVKLIGELKQSLVIFYNEEINKKPVKIFLSGATDIPNFPASLEAELGIPVKAVPAAHLREGLNSLPTDASLNALAGVALAGEEKGLSFILPEIQIKKSIRDKTRELIIVGSFTVYILFLSCAIFLGKIYNQQAYLRRLTQNYGRIERQMGDLM